MTRRGAIYAAVALIALSSLSCRPNPKLAVAPTPRPAEVLLQDVAILDVDSGERRVGLDVRTRGGSIETIGATGTVERSGHATVIDGSGATLLPGLVDLHAVVHAERGDQERERKHDRSA